MKTKRQINKILRACAKQEEEEEWKDKVARAENRAWRDALTWVLED